jgi:hypothetical protein
VPAHVVPAPAAQSLSPLSAMPKHLSMVGCGGFGAATAETAIMVSAAVKELAIVAAAMTLFDFTATSFLKTSKLGRLSQAGAPTFIAKPAALNKRAARLYLVSRASQLCDGDRACK